MNDGLCVKTGLLWRERYSRVIRTGDLFRTPEGWQVRGIPRADWSAVFGTPAERVHAVLADVLIVEREGTAYRDTCAGVVMVAVSDVFRRHVHEWYGYTGLPALLPTERVEDGRI